MRPEGLIYKKGTSPSSGGVTLSLSKVERFAYRLLRSLGAGFVAFSLVAFAFSFGPVIRQEIFFRFGSQGEIPKTSGFGRLVYQAEAQRKELIKKEAEDLGVDSNFSLVIPKINAASDIIANVDASSEDDYFQALERGVAHARGTYFPGQGKNIYLFSHSTDSIFNISRYNAVFYLLGKMEEGDRIIVYFSDERYDYEVKEKVVTGAKDTSWLNETTSEEVLILQTCDPPGTVWKRLLIIAKPL